VSVLPDNNVVVPAPTLKSNSTDVFGGALASEKNASVPTLSGADGATQFPPLGLKSSINAIDAPGLHILASSLVRVLPAPASARTWTTVPLPRPDSGPGGAIVGAGAGPEPTFARAIGPGVPVVSAAAGQVTVRPSAITTITLATAKAKSLGLRILKVI